MGLNWRKSTRSSGNGGACVEVARISTSAMMTLDDAVDYESD
jgi:hypothetical protein